MEANLETRKIEIGEKTLKCLNTIRKWTMFIAVIGFIFLGLLLIIGIVAGTFLTAFKSGTSGTGIPEPLVYLIYLVLAVVYFFPVMYLFRFSKLTAKAVQTLGKEELHKAFKALKAYFVYLGVIIIIGLSLYVVALIVAGSSIAFIKGL